MRIFVFAAVAMAMALIAASAAEAGDRHGRGGKWHESHRSSPWKDGWSIECAGSRLVIEETDPATGAATRVRLAGLTAERSDNVVTIRDGDETVLTTDLTDAVVPPFRLLSLIEGIKALEELCSKGPKDQAKFSALAEATVFPDLSMTGAFVNLFNGRLGNGLILILVLFYILVVIGAGFGLG
jgi:hypothetical protein